MKQRTIVALVALAGLLGVTAFVLAFSPLTKTLFDSSRGGDALDDVAGLLIGILMLFGSAAIAVTWIVACCYLGKRLGYDPYVGLLLVIPVVNLIVFLYWAFNESPNERRLRQLRTQGNRS